MNRTRALRAIAFIGLMAAAYGCDVEPFCLDCVDKEPRDASARDARTGTDSSRVEDGTVNDAGPGDAGPDGCVEGAAELCNERDDDCDGNIDETIDTNEDPANCGGCGIACAPAHAFGECNAGECALMSCDIGWYDLNEDIDDGCEYRCLPTDEDDSACDFRDNDCDGSIDEDVAFDTDPNNCGGCGVNCRFGHVTTARCANAMCTFTSETDCEAGFHDIDGNPNNGCEYACTVVPAGESCNGRDDDCDGNTDEGDPGGGDACGNDQGECVRGVLHCIDGTLSCEGETVATVEQCNGDDDDCDGNTDEGNPNAGRLCGTGVGVCEQGREVCTGGALVCTGAIGPSTEDCDGRDNDCDSRTDENNAGGGAACGTTTGACEAGALQCQDGVLSCVGATGPATETCNRVDDDCDAATDEGNPGGGGSCGTDVGECAPGTRQCMNGALACVGATTAVAETCDNLDNDCDSRVDENNPGGGASCGTETGECSAGAQQCIGGTFQCIGAVTAVAETCDTRDNDCDGASDEGFVLMSDLSNCGVCGRRCSYTNGFAACMSGMCSLAACQTGYYNRDGNAANGCEYACDFAGAEVCNGRDDDCDGTSDESLTPPSNFCQSGGVCSGTVGTCAGATGWQCNYPTTHEDNEVSCDGLDNDCDGAIDEPFMLLGTSCSNGIGACRRTGMYICNATEDNVRCNAPAAGTPGTESCDNVDNDCDTRTDENIPLASIPNVVVNRSGGGTVRVMQYEASRPDATSTSQGSVSSLACSRGGVLPWTNVTWQNARNACCALNAGGTCGATGWRLCDAADWQSACRGPSGNCTWGYDNMCTTSQPTRCNGDEFDCNATTAGNQDCLLATGSTIFPECGADWGAAGLVRDLSGNVKEWTNTQRGSANVHEIRGGSYDTVEGGRSCNFDFTVGDQNFAFPNTGFRCCYY